jgi:hypothetical protein
MRPNLANVERLVRGLVIAPAAFVAAAIVGPDTPAGVILLVVAAAMLITAVVSSCPIWALLGINTQSRAGG